MLRKLIATRNDVSLLVIRVVLGAVMLPHGYQKLMNFSATLNAFSGGMGIPKPLAVLVILAESVGGLMLVLGLVGRLGALGVAAVMVGAIVKVHAPNGFFMNWYGNQKGEGFEYHLLAIAMALAVMIGGSGALSIDGVLQRRRQTAEAPL